MMKAFVAGLLICMSDLSALAQNKQAALDAFFTAAAKNGYFNGTVLVAENGKPIYKKAFGYAVFDTKKPNTLSTQFALASITKSFTATAILQLQENGKLQVTDRVDKYIPGFPYPNITLRHLLSHTSGIRNIGYLFDTLRAQFPDSVFTNREVVQQFATVHPPLMYTPGDKCNYDNVNYLFLAQIIENVSGQTYHDYVRQHIFAPAGMQHTFFPSTTFYYYTEAEKQNMAMMYRYQHLYSSHLEKADTIPFVYAYWHSFNTDGFAEIISTVDDLLAFDQALTHGKLLSPATQQLAYTPVPLTDGRLNTGNGTGKPFGLGWIINSDSTYGKVVRGSGGGLGLRTSLFRNIGRNQTIIMLDNTQNETDNICYDVLKVLNGEKLKPYGKNAARAFGVALVEKGPDAAKILLANMQSKPAEFTFNEDDFNTLGYDLLRDNKLALALETFRVNTLFFPKSWNVYDSYAEALLKTGDKQQAIAMYKQSLALNPQNENGKKVLEEITK